MGPPTMSDAEAHIASPTYRAGKKRVIGRIACGFCRSKKAKCIVYEDPVSPSSSKVSCKACLDQGIPCVFSERRGRGPAKKQNKDSGALSEQSPITTLEHTNGDSSNSIKEYSNQSSLLLSSTKSDKRTSGAPNHPLQENFILKTARQHPGEDDDAVATASRILQRFSESVVMTTTLKSPLEFSAKAPIVLDNREQKNGQEYSRGSTINPDIIKSFDLHAALNQPILPVLNTDLLCPRPMVNSLIKIFLNQIYPVCPLVHRPTFVRDLNEHREEHDKHFFAFLMQLCALVISTIPRKFKFFKEKYPEIKYKGFKEMHAYCQNLSTGAMGLGWLYSGEGYLKWACCYLSMLSGYYAESDRIHSVTVAETTVGVIKALRWNRYPDAFKDENFIEIELRKRAIFLTLMKDWNERMFRENFNVSNSNSLGIVDPTPFMPIGVDDEYITANAILPQPSDISSHKWPIISGFIANVKAFLCVEDFRFGNTSVSPIPLRMGHTDEESTTWQLFAATGVVAANLPPPLSAWSDIYVSGAQEAERERILEQDLAKIGDEWYADTPAIYAAQMESSRANVNVTLLCIQSLLLRKLEAQCRASKLERPQELQAEQEAHLWTQREEVCKNLIRIFGNMSLYNMEANGLSLIVKVQCISASLMNYPTELKGGVLKRAEKYIAKFLDLFMMLLINRDTENEDNIWLALNAQDRLRLQDL